MYKGFNRILSILIFFSFFFTLVGCSSGDIESKINEQNEQTDTLKDTINKQTDKVKYTIAGMLPDNKKDNSTTNNIINPPVTGELKVSFINVGQADAILIQQGTHNMMIDGGNNEDESTLKSYISNQGIVSFETIIGTHCHEDHIGSLDNIISSYNVDKVYFPKQTATTKTYKDFIAAVKNKGLSLTVPKVGETFMLGEAKCTIIAPNGTKYDDANNYSIVLKLEFGNNSFLFCGDAEDISEDEMLSNGLDLKADVLKIGHHGSSSSSSNNFITKVSPSYGVVSVGFDNNYNHPSKKTMDKYKKLDIPIYRTDECGTVIATSNGTDITFNTSSGSYNGK